MRLSHCGVLGLSNPAHKLWRLFTGGDAELFIWRLLVRWRLLHLPGELVKTGLEPFVMCISSFALFYEDLKSVSKQLSNPASRPAPEEWKSHVLHSPGNRKSFSTQTSP